MEEERGIASAQAALGCFGLSHGDPRESGAMGQLGRRVGVVSFCVDSGSSRIFSSELTIMADERFFDSVPNLERLRVYT